MSAGNFNLDSSADWMNQYLNSLQSDKESISSKSGNQTPKFENFLGKHKNKL